MACFSHNFCEAGFKSRSWQSRFLAVPEAFVCLGAKTCLTRGQWRQGRATAPWQHASFRAIVRVPVVVECVWPSAINSPRMNVSEARAYREMYRENSTGGKTPGRRRPFFYPGRKEAVLLSSLCATSNPRPPVEIASVTRYLIP